MTVLRLVALALGHARRRMILSLAATLVAAVAAGGVVYLIGDSTQRSNELLTTLNSPSVRSITIRANTDTTAADLLPARAVTNIAGLEGVDRAVGLSRVQSATTARLRDTQVSVGYFVTATLKGEPPYRLTGGRAPRTGEAITSSSAATRLRLSVPTSAETRVDDELVPIVGTFDAPGLGAITDLFDASLLSPAPSNASGFFVVVLIVHAPADVISVIDATERLLGEFGSNRYSVEYDARAAEVETLVATSGRSGVRSTAIAIMVIGALVEAAVAFVNAVLQRREIARRRALGFTRSMVFGALVIESAVLTGIGATLGAFAATVTLSTGAGAIDLAQPLAAAGFVSLIGVFAALPGGALAAFQDPARILRVP